MLYLIAWSTMRLGINALLFSDFVLILATGVCHDRDSKPDLRSQTAIDH